MRNDTTLERRWSVWGPNSGGGYELVYRGGKLHHHFFGDSAVDGGHEWREQEVRDFVQNERRHPIYRSVCAFLRENGLIE